MATITRSEIDWCTHTWNPVTGCLNSAKHPFCYAKTFWENRVRPGLVKKYPGKYDTVPFEQITWRQENYEKTIPKGAFVFVNSMSDINYWNSEQIHSIRAKYEPYNTTTKFIYLTHHIGGFNKWGYKLHEKEIWGLSITSNEDLRIYLKSYEQRVFDFLSIEPFFLTEKGVRGPRMPDVRVIFGGLTPSSREYEERYKAPFLDFLGCFTHIEHPRVFFKRNLFHTPNPTVPKGTPLAEKKKILKEFWE